jgi:hypothetical protein
MKTRSQLGQAMAEFAVAASLLALLLLGLPAIQRYHQLQFAGIGAARTLAWLGAVPLPQAGGMAPAAGNLDVAALHAGWLPEDAAQRDGDLAQLQSIQPVVGQSRLPGLAGDGTQALLLPFRALQGFGSGFDLRADGLRSAHATLHVASPESLPEPFAGLSLDLDEQHVVLADGWGAAGPGQAASRAGGLVPTHMLAPAQSMLSVGTLLLSVLEPGFRQLCLGLVNPEVVPADRLGNGNGNSAPVTTWVPRC